MRFPESLSLPCIPGVAPDRVLPAAAADAGGGRAPPVESARAEVQGGPDGAESLQPLRHGQMPDRRGLVSRCQAAGTAERSERGGGELHTGRLDTDE